ncbi:hypothetical protein [Amycolatopsis vastitatis]|nr:hypothetical protein [Amycolatopsis vastitatis]
MTHEDLPTGMNELRQGVLEVAEEAPRQARQAARAEFRRAWKWGVLACFLVSLMVALATGVAVLNLYGRAESTDAAVAALRQQAEQSKAQGDQANAELTQRGQTPVPIPEPGKVDDSEVIIAAATARVLASMPTPQPSTSDLGQAVARYLAANPPAPQAPTAQQLAASLAGYFATSPPPSGPPGPAGEPGPRGAAGQDGQDGQDGHTPTRNEIEAAFVGYLQANPTALCPRGGTFAQLRVVLADGGVADTWQCVVTTTPLPSETPTSTETSPPPTN